MDIGLGLEREARTLQKVFISLPHQRNDALYILSSTSVNQLST